MAQGAAAHEGQRGDLDLAAFQPLHHLLRRQHVVERVVERPQIGVDLVAQVAGQEAEAFAGLDRRARQNDAFDPPRRHHLDRGGDRQIGLAGAGGAEAEDQLGRLERGQIVGLHRRAWRDQPLAGADRDLRRRRLAAVGGEPHGGIDLGRIDGKAVLEPAVEALQRGPGDIRRIRRPGDRDPVAARGQRDAEGGLDARQVRVMFAEQRRQQAVVVELQQDRVVVAGRRRDRQAGVLSAMRLGVSAAGPARAPRRLWAAMAAMATRAIVPISAGGAVRWTAWL